MTRQLPLIVSNSEIQTFKTCRRKWWLHYYLELARKKEYKSPVSAANLGTKVHVALRAFYEGKVDPLKVLTSLYEEDIKYWSEIAGDELVTSNLKKEHDLAHAMVTGYVQWVEETGADEDYEVVAAEQRVEVPSGLPQVSLTGKLDTRIIRRVDHTRLFVDHKTVGDLNTPVHMLPRDEQMKFYHLLEKLDAHYRTGGDAPEPTSGALYNMLRKVKRTATAKPPFYRRVEQPHNRAEIETMWERVHAELEDILSCIERLDGGESHQRVVYPRPSRDCTWACDFEPVCSMIDDGSNWQQMLEDHYEHRDPLAHYEEKEI